MIFTCDRIRGTLSNNDLESDFKKGQKKMSSLKSLSVGLRRISGIMLLCSLVIVVTAGAILADTWLNVDVVTKSGVEYLGVRLDFDPRSDSDTLTVTRSEGSIIELLTEEIFMILDSRGERITDMVLRTGSGEVYTKYEPVEPDNTAVDPSDVKRMIEGTRKTKHKGDGKVTVKRSTRFKLAFSAGTGYSGTYGDWFEGMESGPDIWATMKVKAFETYYFGAHFKRQSVGVANSILGTYEVCDYYGCYNFNIDEYNIHLNEYYFIVGRRTPDEVNRSAVFYVDMGLGAVSHNFDITMSDGDSRVNDKSSLTKMGVYTAGGAMIPFNSKVGLALDFSMRITGTSGETVNGIRYKGSSGILFGAHAGIVVFIGG